MSGRIRRNPAAGSPFVLVRAWSRDWWAVMLHRLRRGQPVDFMILRAKRGRGDRAALTCRAIDVAAARPDDLISYRCNGREMDAWRPWLAARGARLQPFDAEAKFSVFLPGPEPPPAL